MSKIFKYPLDPEQSQNIKILMPASAMILHVASIHNSVYLYAISHGDKSPDAERIINIYRSEQNIPDETDKSYIGSVLYQGIEMIHVFEVKRRFKLPLWILDSEFDTYFKKEARFHPNLEQSYLSYLKEQDISSCMAKRVEYTLEADLSKAFTKWADGYFGPGSGNLNKGLDIRDVYYNFRTNSVAAMSMSHFIQALQKYCDISWYIISLDHSRLIDDGGKTYDVICVKSNDV